MTYCTLEEFASQKCTISNSVVKKQWINEFLYETEKTSPIYSSIGTSNQGDVFFESSLGTPYSTKRLFTLKDDGREYIDGIKKNIINSGNNMYSKFGIGAVVTINDHRCYMKLSHNESLEMYDFDDKKYTFASMKEKFGYPDSIKMCPLGDRYRFRPNGDFMLLFYCDRAKGLYLPESFTHLYSGIF
jgi:hypothetical protein